MVAEDHAQRLLTTIISFRPRLSPATPGAAMMAGLLAPRDLAFRNYWKAQQKYSLKAREAHSLMSPIFLAPCKTTDSGGVFPQKAVFRMRPV